MYLHTEKAANKCIEVSQSTQHTPTFGKGSKNRTKICV